MTEEIRLQMLAKCEAIDRIGRAYLDTHPDTPRYCYTCQVWLENQTATGRHRGHSIH